MRPLKYSIHLLTLVIMLGVSMLSTHAATPAIRTTLLDHQAGAPGDPKNIKLNIVLPESYGHTTFNAEDFNIYIYPQALDINTGRREQYHADKLLLWQHNNQLFIDVRHPPEQRSGGECTVYVEIVKNNRSIYKAELPDKVRYDDDEADVILIIDSSLSMHSNDPYRNRHRAAKAFVDIARTDTRIRNIGIISFNNEPTVVADLTPVRNSRRLHKAIDSIDASGQTDIGAALQSGLALLDFATSKRTAIVLLTDGKNESSVYQNQHLELAKTGIPVYCIGLSDQADTSLLKMIAEDTNASFFKAATDNDLLGIYQRIASVISRREIIFSKKIPYTTEKISIPVDNSIKDISFMLNASMDEVIFHLLSPAGDRIEVTPSKNSNFSEIRITKPEAGLWSAEISNRASKRDLELNVTGNTSLYLDAFPPLQADNKIWLSGTLTDAGAVIPNSKVQVISQRGSIELYDDGKHNDGKEHDGIYTCSIPIEREFDLELLMRAWGTKQLPYIRQTSAGTLKRHRIIVEAPKERYELRAENALTFDTAIAGEVVTSQLNLDYSGPANTLTADFSSMDNSVYKIDSKYLALNDTALTKGKNTVTVSLNIPSQMPSGAYRGSVNLTTSDTEITVPVSVKILDAELIVDKDRIDLGYVDEDKLHTCTVNLYLQAIHAEELSITAKNPDFEVISQKSVILQPNTRQSVEFSIRSTDLSLKEEQTQKITLRSGEFEKEMTLTYLLTPKSKEHKTLLLAHELSLAEVGHKVAAISLTHEMSVSAPVYVTKAVEPIIAEPVKESAISPLSASETLPAAVKADPAVIQAMDTEENFLLLLIITATIALAVIFLVLRKLSSKRMVRFALLSATLHLPIIALIASYVLVTREAPAITSKKAPIANMIIASAPIEKSYIEENTQTLKNFSNDKSSALSEFNPITAETSTAELTENSELYTATAQLTTQTSDLPKLEAEPFLSQEFKAEPELLKTQNHFAINNMLAHTPIKLEPEHITQNKAELEREVINFSEPEAPLDEIFASTEAVTTQEIIPSSANAAALANVIEEDISISDEINNILNAAEQETAVTKNDKAQTFEPAAAADILPEINKTVFAEAADNNELKEVNMPTKLSRDLNSEIDQTSRLRSLAQHIPVSEEPAQLLASIDKTAPIEVAEEADLAIPAEDIPDELTSIADDIFTDSTETKSVITEIIPRRTAVNIAPSEFETEPIESIPGITSDGLCLDFESINESLNLSREADEQIDSAILPNSPVIDDLKLDSIMLERDAEEAKPLAVEKAEDNNILEQEIEIPGSDALNIIPELETKPKVIAAIDNLDINFNKKIDKLTLIDKTDLSQNIVIKRESKPAKKVDLNTEEYVPSQPNLNKISSTEEIRPYAKINRVNELSSSSIAEFEITDKQNDFADTSLTDLPVARINIAEEPSVKIINSPKRLDNTLTSGVELLKLPQSIKGSEMSATDSDINEVALNIGLLSSAETAIDSITPEVKNVKLINLNNSSQNDSEILSCQLIITNKSAFSSSEIMLLKDYLTSGGHLWIQDQGIPEELISIGKIKPIEKDDTLFNAAYEISRRNILFAEELSVNARRTVIATGCREQSTNKPLLTNVFTTFFGAYQQESDSPADSLQNARLTSYTWQNFAGIDERKIGWKGPKWGNIIQTGIAPNGQGGEALRVAVKPGHEDITSINYIIPDHEGRRIDLSANTAIILDIFNAGKKYVGISLGLTTESRSSGWDEFETDKVNLKAGWNRGVIIPLQNFRSRRDPEGGYSHNLEAPDNCARVSLYFSNIKDGGNLLIDNIKWAEPKISINNP